MKGLKGEGQMEAGTGNHGPSTTWTFLHFSPYAWAHQYGFNTPIDEKNLRRFALQARNFRIQSDMDDTINERNAAVTVQDHASGSRRSVGPLRSAVSCEQDLRAQITD